MRKKYIKTLIIILFLAVPTFSSFISTIHLINLFSLGNNTWISIILSLVYEIGSLAAFVTPFVLTKLNKPLLWSVFIILVFLQILGNVYYSFEYINIQLISNPQWLDSFKELSTYFVGNDISQIKIFLSSLISVPIPLISLFFLKAVISYIEPENAINGKTDDESKEIKELIVEKSRSGITGGDENQKMGTTEPEVPGITGIPDPPPKVKIQLQDVTAKSIDRPISETTKEIKPKHEKILIKDATPSPEIEREYPEPEPEAQDIPIKAKIPDVNNDIYLKDGQGIPLHPNKAKDSDGHI